jgi:hypothetical protein
MREVPNRSSVRHTMDALQIVTCLHLTVRLGPGNESNPTQSELWAITSAFVNIVNQGRDAEGFFQLQRGSEGKSVW